MQTPAKNVESQEIVNPGDDIGELITKPGNTPAVATLVGYEVPWRGFASFEEEGEAFGRGGYIKSDAAFRNNSEAVSWMTEYGIYWAMPPPFPGAKRRYQDRATKKARQNTYHCYQHIDNSKRAILSTAADEQEFRDTELFLFREGYKLVLHTTAQDKAVAWREKRDNISSPCPMTAFNWYNETKKMAQEIVKPVHRLTAATSMVETCPEIQLMEETKGEKASVGAQAPPKEATKETKVAAGGTSAAGLFRSDHSIVLPKDMPKTTVRPEAVQIETQMASFVTITVPASNRRAGGAEKMAGEAAQHAGD